MSHSNLFRKSWLIIRFHYSFKLVIIIITYHKV
nr:MAG TPA: hypothetical protein [Caudoviricetes sp.]